MKNVLTSLLLLVALLLFGTAGYMLLEGSSFTDGLFMTVITIASVGYNESVPLDTTGRYFTMGLILLGMGFMFYIVSRISRRPSSKAACGKHSGDTRCRKRWPD